jgi:glycosyltransferase involved in cell wall biosynthesis
MIPHIISEQWSGYTTGKFAKSSFIKKATARLLVGNASALTCVSTFLLKKMKDNGLKNKNNRVIPNVIENVTQLTPAGNKNGTEILLVADLVDEIKNISGVIKAIGALRDSSSVNLRIVGGGPDEQKLKSLTSELKLNDKISFEGLKTNAEVYEYLQRCDFLVMNSRFETFSLICAESMSCGKPVVATRCGGPDEFVTKETGILIEPGNENELVSAINYMLNNLQNYNSEAIKKYSQELFSIEIASKSFEEVYKNAIKQFS